MCSCAMPKRWSRIEPGMSKEDVLHFVGQPTRRTYDGNFTNGNEETWYFDNPKPHSIRFQNGRVINLTN